MPLETLLRKKLKFVSSLSETALGSIVTLFSASFLHKLLIFAYYHYLVQMHKNKTLSKILDIKKLENVDKPIEAANGLPNECYINDDYLAYEKESKKDGQTYNGGR